MAGTEGAEARVSQVKAKEFRMSQAKLGYHKLGYHRLRGRRLGCHRLRGQRLKRMTSAVRTLIRILRSAANQRTYT